MRESVIRNTDRIDTLYDLRKSDNEHLSKKVEKLVVDKIANVGPPRQREAAPDDNDRDFLRFKMGSIFSSGLLEIVKEM